MVGGISQVRDLVLRLSRARSLHLLSFICYLLSFISVTNHAGHVISGELGTVTNGTFVIGSRTLPLSVLPASEQMRVKKLAGQDVRTPWERKVDADLGYELKRIDARLAEGEITPEQANQLRQTSRNAAAYRRGQLHRSSPQSTPLTPGTVITK